MEILSNMHQGIQQTSGIEWVAVLLNLLYVLLIAKKIRWGWWSAFVSSILFTYLCISTQLYIESALQLFYVAMALYGWFIWNENSREERLIRKWSIQSHVLNIAISSFVTLLLGYIMSKFTDQASPYLDAFTTVFSLTATFMAAKRVLENWLYWIVIDTAAIFLYAGRELYLASLQYLIFTIIAIFAYLSWVKMYQKQVV
ncbi:MAG: nicotinamide riboside transporter PnuC [Brumimicrobium sp.]|nr:nicotinamide riboside transporter PnuC [Brumimicrobium sp.]